METDLLLQLKDVAEIFHKDIKGIRNWLQNGVLPRNVTVKIGRNVYFHRDKLNAFIESKLTN